MALTNLEFSLIIALKNEDNSRAHLKSTGHLSLHEGLGRLVLFYFILILQVLVEWASLIGRYLLNVVFILVVRILRHCLIRQHFLIKVQLDASNVGSTDSTFKVEALAPPSEDVHTLIILEDILVFVHMGWLDWGKISDDVSTVVTRVNGWRVESMVVSWGQVDNHVVEMVTSLLDRLEHFCNTFVVKSLLIVVSDLVITTETEHELVKSVGSSLDTVDGTELRVDLSTSEDGSIAWRTHALFVLWLVNGSDSILEVASEELGEGWVGSEIWLDDFLHVDTIHSSKATVHDVSHEDWELERADEAGEA